MYFHTPAITIERGGCRVVGRRVPGCGGEEIFLTSEPRVEGTATEQAEVVFEGLWQALSEVAQGRTVSIVTQTLYLRNIARDREAIRSVGRRTLNRHGFGEPNLPSFEVEQPPLDGSAFFQVAVQALLSPVGVTPKRDLVGPPRLRGDAANPQGLRLVSRESTRLYALGLCGQGEGASEQALSMFQLAETLLEESGLAWRDVVRTWIHLADIEQDYDTLNEVRRSFFEARALHPVPASTGIGGIPVSPENRLSLGFFARREGGTAPSPATPMSAPTLNEAATYGADFVRGMRVNEAEKVSLYVSGTASIDEQGRTAHAGDIERQIDRMILNVLALLAEQGAGLDDIVSATTYLKHPGDRSYLFDRYQNAGFQGFPHTLVVAPICRQALLCEVEVVAVRASAVRPV